jgi:sarcosine oxidase subunit beta
MQTAEVAIIGGGVMGCSIAYHLASLGRKDVVIFEREELLGMGATAKCAGGVRLQFSTPANIALSQWSISALNRFEEEIGEPVDFRQNGYLFVLTRESDLDVFRKNAHRQQEMGVPVQLISPEEARKIVPDLDISDLVGATFCAEDGLVNPHAMVQGYAKQARNMGATIQMSTEVTEMEVSSRKIHTLVAGGERWGVEWVVNAAGPWAGRVGQLAGTHVPVQPFRRMGFTSEPLGWVADNFPMLIDWSTGVYMHKESGGMLMGESDRDEPPSFNQQVDWDYLARIGEHAIRRVPRLSESKIRSGWAGLYEVSPDHNAILGMVPDLENLVCANGFSGHGMMHSPAVGQALAELMTLGTAKSIDLGPYSIQRFNLDEHLPEHNVI